MASIFDEARSIRGMISMRGLTQSEIAGMLGVSQSYIANKLRLLSFSDECQEKICRGSLTERHARAMLRLGSEEDRLRAIEDTVARRLTVAECEALVDMLKEKRLPRIIPEVDRAKRMLVFEEGLDASVRALRSLGVDITKRERHDGTRTYITLCIADQQ